MGMVRKKVSLKIAEKDLNVLLHIFSPDEEKVVLHGLRIHLRDTVDTIQHGQVPQVWIKASPQDRCTKGQRVWS
ncbi:MAG: hypothetical protein DRO12_01110 [Thermoprotei archaeon]|nr:MAG: hypothetical protein DRO12_01110 [Thermoprotei archaeon]